MTNNKINQELLNCPFCGTESAYHAGGWGEGMHAIVCRTTPRLCPIMVFRKIDVSKEMMVKAWNTRATAEAQAQGVDEKEVVEVMAAAHYECTGNSVYPSKWDSLNDNGKNNWRKPMQAALKALADNAYKVIKIATDKGGANG